MSAEATVDLYWIPLGAGASFVRCNGVVYEAIAAALARRARRNIFHTALEVTIDGQRYAVEMTPVPDGEGGRRGVVATGPVGSRVLGRLRVFRYEVRRWLDGDIPDLRCAVASPVRVTEDAVVARRIFEELASVPPATWGRDELRTGDMWSCNSIISWALTRAGVDVLALPAPADARAPGWDAGRLAALRRSAAVGVTRPT